MFVSVFLKKVLPFTLTLLVGALLGGAFNLFGWLSAPRAERGARAFVYQGRSSSYRPRLRHRTAREDFTPVVFTYEPNTRYTEEARRKATTGVVRLRVTFGASGRVEAVEPILRLPDGLTEQAERVAWQIKFLPATQYGEAVTTTKELDYVFALSDRMAAGL